MLPTCAERAKTAFPEGNVLAFARWILAPYGGVPNRKKRHVWTGAGAPAPGGVGRLGATFAGRHGGLRQGSLDLFRKPGMSIGGRHKPTACTNHRMRLTIFSMSNSKINLNTSSIDKGCPRPGSSMGSHLYRW